MSDLGPSAAARIRQRLKDKRFGLEISERELKQAVAEEIAEIEGNLADKEDEQVSTLAAAYAPHDIDDLQQESLEALHGMLGLSPESVPDLSEERTTQSE